MSIHSSKRLGISAIAVLPILAIVIAFSATAVSAKAGDRPFKGTMVNNDAPGAPYPDFSTGDLQLWLDVEISGEIHATHIGKGVVDGFATINITDFVFGPQTPGGPVCSELIEGTIDFTAANGDEINMVMTENQLCIDTGIFTGQYEVVSGTGRFDSAEGVISASGLLLPGEPSVTELTGTIVY